MAHETEAVIGLGANLGNPEEALGEALRRLDKVPGGSCRAGKQSLPYGSDRRDGS